MFRKIPKNPAQLAMTQPITRDNEKHVLLYQLPSELMKVILCLVTHNDLYTLRAVSSFFEGLLENKPIWKQKIKEELQVDDAKRAIYRGLVKGVGYRENKYFIMFLLARNAKLNYCTVFLRLNRNGKEITLLNELEQPITSEDNTHPILKYSHPIDSYQAVLTLLNRIKNSRACPINFVQIPSELKRKNPTPTLDEIIIYVEKKQKENKKNPTCRLS